MQHHFVSRASRTPSSHLSATYLKPAPQAWARYAKPSAAGLSSAQLRQIVLEQLG